MIIQTKQVAVLCLRKLKVLNANAVQVNLNLKRILRGTAEKLSTRMAIRSMCVTSVIKSFALARF